MLVLLSDTAAEGNLETAILRFKECQSEGNKLVLVVARPGRLRSSLQALLQIMPRLKVAELGDSVSAIVVLAQHHPVLVILDIDLPEDQAWVLLEQVQQTRPQTRCLFLVNSLEQRRAAKIAGADAALLKGFGSSELFMTLEKLLKKS